MRFEGFDSSYDEWLPRKDITVPALLEYEKFLERNARANNFSGPENTAYVSVELTIHAAMAPLRIESGQPMRSSHRSMTVSAPPDH